MIKIDFGSSNVGKIGSIINHNGKSYYTDPCPSCGSSSFNMSGCNIGPQGVTIKELRCGQCGTDLEVKTKGAS